ncbi:MAG: acyltransferase family protein [Deltaproteobacteria bacterium]|nr:acyltransferase family protein [Deltaproteobacteria bacterium]
MFDQLLRAVVVPEVEAAIEKVAAEIGDYDPWGLAPQQAKIYFSLAYRIARYFRPVIHGIENLPKGRCLLVPNHSGQLPFDALVVAVACLVDASPPRLVRAMAERWFPTLPFVNIAFSRAGVTVGDPINGRNLLEAENALLVFPEGTRGSGKTWDHRYRLVPFGRGFMRLALQTGSPIIPVGVVGAEESIISLHNAQGIADLLRMPYFPIPALLPLLGPLAYLPLPTQFHVYFGEPLTFEGPFDDEDEAIEAKVTVVMEHVQGLLDRGLEERTGIF